jgi:hypothetical protein
VSGIVAILVSLPDLLYTDGNWLSLWQNGKLTGKVLIPMGDVETPRFGVANAVEAEQPSASGQCLSSTVNLNATPHPAPEQTPLKLPPN